MSRSFEDLVVGEALLSASRTISANDVETFTELTGDRNPIHVSEEYAKQTRFGRRVAHGALVFSVSLGLLWGEERDRGDILAIVSVERLRFTQPVFLGDTLRVRQTLKSLDALNKESGLVEAQEEVLNQDDVVVMSYTAKFLVRRRG